MIAFQLHIVILTQLKIKHTDLKIGDIVGLHHDGWGRKPMYKRFTKSPQITIVNLGPGERESIFVFNANAVDIAREVGVTRDEELFPSIHQLLERVEGPQRRILVGEMRAVHVPLSPSQAYTMPASFSIHDGSIPRDIRISDAAFFIGSIPEQKQREVFNRNSLFAKDG